MGNKKQGKKGKDQKSQAIEKQLGQEKSKHETRLAKFEKMKKLAEGDEKTLERINKLAEKENKRFEKKIKKIEQRKTGVSDKKGKSKAKDAKSGKAGDPESKKE